MGKAGWRGGEGGIEGGGKDGPGLDGEEEERSTTPALLRYIIILPYKLLLYASILALNHHDTLHIYISSHWSLSPNNMCDRKHM